MALLGGATVYLRTFDVRSFRFERVIRKMSDCTFPLYATHYPVIWAIAAICTVQSAGRSIALVVIPLLVAWLLAGAGNRLRDWMRVKALAKVAASGQRASG